MVRTRSLRPIGTTQGRPWHDCGRSCANSGTLKPLHTCVDRTFVKSVAPACREFFLVEAVARRLLNDGHDTRSPAHYLGHRNLQSTARYTALGPDRFAKFWRD